MQGTGSLNGRGMGQSRVSWEIYQDRDPGSRLK